MNLFIEDNKNWGWFLLWGIALVILGMIAISVSTFTTMLSVMILGTLIVIGSALIIVDSFKFWKKKWDSFLLHFVLGVMYLIVGAMLIKNPVLGSVSLTLVLGVFYTILGISRITYSLSARAIRWQWTFLNGFISLLLGILILTNWPSSSLFIIGLFVGIDLIFVGITYCMIALAPRSHI